MKELKERTQIGESQKNIISEKVNFKDKITEMTISLPRQESQDWSSVGRELDCRAGGRGFDSRGRTNTQFLK